jgi:hypothetical protein
MQWQQHNVCTVCSLVIILVTSITLNILVGIEWIKYIIDIEVHFVGYLYIMGLITKCISVKQTHMHINSAYVIVFMMKLWVCEPKFRNK